MKISHIIKVVGLLAGSAFHAFAGAPDKAPLTDAADSKMQVAFSGGATVGYDGNVYLQDGGALGHITSWVGRLQAGVEISRAISRENRIGLKFTPERVAFFGADEEDHTLLPVVLDWTGRAGALDWRWNTDVLFVEGPDAGPFYLEQGGSPAIGAFTVRDRRDAFRLRQVASVRWTSGSIFLRPVFSGYYHDFQTKLYNQPGYCNYLDRSDFSSGLDFGLKGGGDFWWVAGWRAGSEWQANTPWNTERYSNIYQRLLVGAEGSPFPWMTCKILLGPTFYDFGDETSDIFEGEHVRLFSDASVTVRPSRLDSITASYVQFEQMSASGCGAYQDILFRAWWTHKFEGTPFETRVGGDIRRGIFEAPSTRDDWIFYPGIECVWHVTPRIEVSLQGVYEWSASEVPNTPGRVYERPYAGLSVKAAF